ncbi:hypothetical protein [Hahella ganghwensis]|uniref:hypothetical protein n=1 Tax=Hahella ganghwensis TaxID=286420 RepID=UPI000373E0D7|nr:hypothetical protein [Hahella ganghwensis]
MKLRIKYRSWIPRLLGVDAVTIYPFIFFKHSVEQCKEASWFPKLFKHELIHVEQVRRLGWWNFYVTYLWFQVAYGYKRNPFEVEAYKRQDEDISPHQKLVMLQSWGWGWIEEK